MKRVLLHALFWLLYFFQNVLLIFFVNGTRLAQTPGADGLLAMANCAVLLLPKMLFTYWVFRFGLGGTDKSIGQGRRIVHTVLALLLALVLYRALVVYVIDPYIYHWRSGQPLWYALGFLVALMDIGFVGGAALAIRLFREQRAAGLRESALLQAQLESELRFLRNQTNPHFLFNTLNNIYALARKNSDAVP
ncbi:MAG: histidine kinase, partial [Chitinophagaceae bacterium]